MRARFHLQVVIIHAPGLFLQVITDGIEHQSAEVHRRTVAQVTAVAQVQTHERVAGFQTGHEHSHIRLCAGVGLYVHVLGVVELFEPVAGDVLRDIYHLATSVITVTRVALRVLIGQHAAHGFQHLVAHEVLAGNQLNTFCLTFPLTADDVKNSCVSIHCNLTV